MYSKGWERYTAFLLVSIQSVGEPETREQVSFREPQKKSVHSVTFLSVFVYPIHLTSAKLPLRRGSFTCISPMIYV